MRADALDTAARDAGVSDAALPQPTAALITRWRQDPFARGSYSYLAAGSSPSDRDALRADVSERLFFAGEATSSDYPATVHGALLEGRSAAERIMDKADEDDEIAIIGAGIAGLAAARTLTDEGYAVFVLEARDRLGGRMYTDDSLGFPVDLGAAWIHGASGNPLLDLVEAADVETRVTDEDDVVFYDAQGGTGDDDDLEEVVAALEELSGNGDADSTLGELIADALEDADDDTVELATYAFTSLVEHEYAAPVADLSVRAVEEGEEFGGDELTFPTGYASLLTPLTNGVSITTGQIVERIALAEDDVVIGGAGGAELRTDRVLVTVPLGVLQAGGIEFVPALPAEKLTAIDSLGMGLLDRVVLQFEERFWDDADVIGFVGNEPGVFVEWYDLTEQVGTPVIVGFNAADVADDLALKTDEEVIATAMRALVTMYGS